MPCAALHYHLFYESGGVICISLQTVNLASDYHFLSKRGGEGGIISFKKLDLASASHYTMLHCMARHGTLDLNPTLALTLTLTLTLALALSLALALARTQLLLSLLCVLQCPSLHYTIISFVGAEVASSSLQRK